MAIGLAWMFGVRFPDNFAQPYRARCMIEYWQRWHMSLTRFLVANVHAPVTLAILRRRRGAGRPIDLAAQRTPSGFLCMIAAPILLTMVLVGVWHGPALNFLLFGLLHTALLLINHGWRIRGGRDRFVGVAPVPGRRLIGGRVHRVAKRMAPSLSPVVAATLTYLGVLVGAVLFRAASVPDAVAMLGGMAGLHGGTSITADLHDSVDTLWIIGLYLIVWLMPSTREIMEGGGATTRGGLSERLWRPTPAWAVALGCAATLGLLASGGTGEFVYFHF